MEVRSAINILFSKFNINYRVFLYLFVVTAIVIAIAASAVMPTFNEVIKNPETTESFTAVTNTFADYLRGQTTFSQVIASGKTFYHTVIDLMNATNATAAFWVTVVGFVFHKACDVVLLSRDFRRYKQFHEQQYVVRAFE